MGLQTAGRPLSMREKRNLKKIEKNLKKGVDRRSGVWYYNQVAARDTRKRAERPLERMSNAGRHRTLKIKQRETKGPGRFLEETPRN